MELSAERSSMEDCTTNEFGKKDIEQPEPFEFIPGTLFEEDSVEYYFQLFLKISEVAEKKAMLAGNTLLNKLTPDVARPTKDLDMAIDSLQRYEVVAEYLKAVGEQLLADGIISKFEIKEIEPARCGGIKCYNMAGETSIQLDVSEDTNMKSRTVQYCVNDAAFNENSLEAIICDKCSASLSSEGFRRAKDFYDLYIISKKGIKIDTKRVLDLMIAKVGADEVDTLLEISRLARLS